MKNNKRDPSGANSALVIQEESQIEKVRHGEIQDNETDVDMEMEGNEIANLKINKDEDDTTY